MPRCAFKTITAFSCTRGVTKPSSWTVDRARCSFRTISSCRTCTVHRESRVSRVRHFGGCTTLTEIIFTAKSFRSFISKPRTIHARSTITARSFFQLFGPVIKCSGWARFRETRQTVVALLAGYGRGHVVIRTHFSGVTRSTFPLTNVGLIGSWYTTQFDFASCEKVREYR